MVTEDNEDVEEETDKEDEVVCSHRQQESDSHPLQLPQSSHHPHLTTFIKTTSCPTCQQLAFILHKPTKAKQHCYAHNPLPHHNHLYESENRTDPSEATRRGEPKTDSTTKKEE